MCNVKVLSLKGSLPMATVFGHSGLSGLDAFGMEVTPRVQRTQ